MPTKLISDYNGITNLNIVKNIVDKYDSGTFFQDTELDDINTFG